MCACVVCQYHLVFHCHRRPTQHSQRVKTKFSNKVTKKKLVECTQIEPTHSQRLPKTELSAGVYDDSRELRGKRIHNLNHHALPQKPCKTPGEEPQLAWPSAPVVIQEKKVNTMIAWRHLGHLQLRNM